MRLAVAYCKVLINIKRFVLHFVGVYNGAMHHRYTSTKWLLLFVHKRKQFTLIKSPTNDNRQPTTIKLNRTKIQLNSEQTQQKKNDDEEMQK